MPKHKWIALAACLFFYLGGIVIALYFCADMVTIQTLAVILTGIILIWYTWETMLLRLIASSQRELDLQPFVIYKNLSGQHWIENAGRGVAINISINTLEIGDSSYRLEILFPKKIPILKPGKSQQLTPTVKINGNEVNNLHASHLNPIYANQDTEVEVTFSNTEKTRYSVKETVSPHNLEINQIIKLS